jgi:hypothetical protein
LTSTCFMFASPQQNGTQNISLCIFGAGAIYIIHQLSLVTHH